MDSMELHRQLMAYAKRLLADGLSPEDIEAHAQMQEQTGFSVSAPYTRCVASFMRSLQQKGES
jgi:hypothetical protein